MKYDGGIIIGIIPIVILLSLYDPKNKWDVF